LKCTSSKEIQTRSGE